MLYIKYIFKKIVKNLENRLMSFWDVLKVIINSEICAHQTQVSFCLSFKVAVGRAVHGTVFFTDKLHKIPFAWCAADSLQCTSSNSECLSRLKAEECWGKWDRMLKFSSQASACSVGWFPSLPFEVSESCAERLTGLVSQDTYRQALVSIFMCGIHMDLTSGATKHLCKSDLGKWVKKGSEKGLVCMLNLVSFLFYLITSGTTFWHLLCRSKCSSLLGLLLTSSSQYFI